MLLDCISSGAGIAILVLSHLYIHSIIDYCMNPFLNKRLLRYAKQNILQNKQNFC